MRLLLRFDASQKEPDLRAVFMRDGGSINAAVVRGETDFAVTGSKGAVHTTLHPLGTRTVEVEVPDTVYELEEDGDHGVRVLLDRGAKLHASMSRLGPAINGPTVSSVSGRGARAARRALRAARCALTALRACLRRPPVALFAAAV